MNVRSFYSRSVDVVPKPLAQHARWEACRKKEANHSWDETMLTSSSSSLLSSSLLEDESLLLSSELSAFLPLPPRPRPPLPLVRFRLGWPFAFKVEAFAEALFAVVALGGMVRVKRVCYKDSP